MSIVLSGNTSVGAGLIVSDCSGIKSSRGSEDFVGWMMDVTHILTSPQCTFNHAALDTPMPPVMILTTLLNEVG